MTSTDKTIMMIRPPTPEELGKAKYVLLVSKPAGGGLLANSPIHLFAIDQILMGSDVITGLLDSEVVVSFPKETWYMQVQKDRIELYSDDDLRQMYNGQSGVSSELVGATVPIPPPAVDETSLGQYL